MIHSFGDCLLPRMLLARTRHPFLVASATSTIEIFLLFDSLTDSHLCPQNLCTVWVIPLYADVIYGSPQN